MDNGGIMDRGRYSTSDGPPDDAKGDTVDKNMYGIVEDPVEEKIGVRIGVKRDEIVE